MQSAIPAPTAMPIGGFVALIGGDVVNSSYVIDGGFFKAADGYPPAAESYIDNQPNPYQQFIFAPSGSNYTICNVQNGACLTDGGNLLDIGQGTDTWAEVPFGSGWSLQDTRTGQYMGAIPSTLGGNIPMSSTPVSLSIGILSRRLPRRRRHQRRPGRQRRCSQQYRRHSHGNGSFVALIGGNVVNSSYVIDGGFFKAADGSTRRGIIH